MILKSLTIEGYGPFYHPATIKIDDGVTVLTGQNDVGKSLVLRLITMICANTSAAEDDVNTDRLYSANRPWVKDDGVKCTATFKLDKDWHSYINTPDKFRKNLTEGMEVDVLFMLTRNAYTIAGFRNVEGKPYNPGEGFSLSRRPTVMSLPLDTEINTTISAGDLNPLESYLLEIAFGGNSISKLNSLSRPVITTFMKRANRRLNDELQKLLPYSLKMELRLDIERTEPLEFTLSLEDSHGGFTPLHLRGLGVRKIVSLMVALKQVANNDNYLYVLYDEPETSLHADSQHVLRAFLEDLSLKSNIQVIYATHSPSMINPFQVSGVRLLERKLVDGVVTAVVDNKPYRDNFVRIRTSLGISPSDSLLYAPVSIIIEGDSEAVCLPVLLERLYKANVPGFEDVDRIFSLVHFVSGMGDNLDLWCRMARSQGAKPVVFVDGDKGRRVKQLQKQKKLDGTPVIILDDDSEFEDLVSPEWYFEGLAAVTNQPMPYEKYLEWEKEANLPERMLFSKRVHRWVKDSFGFDLDKPSVMKAAIEKAPLDQINLEPIEKLMTAIRQQLSSKADTD